MKAVDWTKVDHDIFSTKEGSQVLKQNSQHEYVPGRFTFLRLPKELTYNREGILRKRCQGNT